MVGSPRSGSTLLRAMLDGHPALAIPPESHFIAEFARDRRLVRDFDFDRFLLRLGKHRRFRLWALSPDEVAAAAGHPASLAAAVRAVYRAYASRHGKDRYGDKTPGYALHVPLLAALLPEAVFVHLVRDGRDVALSLLEAGFGPSTVRRAAAYWKQRVDAARHAGAELGPRRYLEVRYEELVVDPEPALRAICALAALDYQPAMAEHRSRAAAVAASTLDPDLHRKLGAPLHAARDWRQEMSAAQVARFERVAGSTLTALGYPPAGAAGDGA